MTNYDNVISFDSEEAGILLEVIGETYNELRIQLAEAEVSGDADTIYVVSKMMDDIKPIYDRLAEAGEEDE